MFRKTIVLTMLSIILFTQPAVAYEVTGKPFVDALVKLLGYEKACGYEITPESLKQYFSDHIDYTDTELMEYIDSSAGEIKLLILLDPKSAEVDKSCPIFKTIGEKLKLIES